MTVTTIQGSFQADTLQGTPGDDLMVGSEGDDVLLSSPGNDTLDGGPTLFTSERDFAWYGSETSPVIANLLSGHATVGGGVDTLIRINGLFGGESDDQLTGDASNNWLNGWFGNDVIAGGGGQDTLSSSAGNDTMDGGDGDDLLELTTWTRGVIVDLAAGIVSAGGFTSRVSSIEIVLAGAGDDSLVGSALADSLRAGDGQDTLIGGAGNDTLQGGLGNDSLDGGDGIDVISFLGEPAVHVNLTSGVASGSSLGEDRLQGIEVVAGGWGDDLLEGSPGSDTLDGWNGANTLRGADGDDVLANGALLEGGNGNDRLSHGMWTGDSMVVTMLGGAGNDTLEGQANTHQFGGDGDDVLGADVRPGDALYDGGSGFDILRMNLLSGYVIEVTVDFASGHYEGTIRDWYGGRPVSGTWQMRSIEGMSASGAVLIGDDRDNLLDGGRVIGGAGNDTLRGGTADYRQVGVPMTIDPSASGSGWLVRFDGQTDVVETSSLLLGAGDDVVLDAVFARTRGTISGGPGNDLLIGASVGGGGGNDTLSGGIAYFHDTAGPVVASLLTGTAVGPDGTDTLLDVRGLEGTTSADHLTGDERNNTLTGGGGDDTLLGGAGDDVLVISRGRAHVDGNSGVDRLVLTRDVAVVGRQEVDLRNDSLVLRTSGGTFDVSIRGVEVVDLAALVDGALTFALTGLDGPSSSRGEWFVAGIGNHTVNGGAGIDVFEYREGTDSDSIRYRSVEQLPGAGVQLRVTHQWSDRVDHLQDVERIRFEDGVRAFGERAIDVARVAFALWSKDIAGSTTLFGKGVDWYDDGHTFDEAVRYALSFFTEKSDAQLAADLASHVPAAGRSAADLLALMASHGGGLDGRAYVTTLMANDPVNLANVQAAGFNTTGIACSLFWGTEALFLLPPGV